jgi:hypothetical protein
MVRQNMCESDVYNWGVDSSLHIKLATAGLRKFNKYIVCLWFTQYRGPTQVTQ